MPDDTERIAWRKRLVDILEAELMAVARMRWLEQVIAYSGQVELKQANRKDSWAENMHTKHQQQKQQQTQKKERKHDMLT